VPLRKSDRRRLRDRVVNDALLLVVDGTSKRGDDDGEVVVGDDIRLVQTKTGVRDLAGNIDEIEATLCQNSISKHFRNY